MLKYQQALDNLKDSLYSKTGSQYIALGDLDSHVILLPLPVGYWHVLLSLAQVAGSKTLK